MTKHSHCRSSFWRGKRQEWGAGLILLCVHRARSRPSLKSHREPISSACQGGIVKSHHGAQAAGKYSSRVQASSPWLKLSRYSPLFLVRFTTCTRVMRERFAGGGEGGRGRRRACFARFLGLLHLARNVFFNLREVGGTRNVMALPPRCPRHLCGFFFSLLCPTDTFRALDRSVKELPHAAAGPVIFASAVHEQVLPKRTLGAN